MLVKSYGSARVEVSDPTNLGPVLAEADVLSQVSSILDGALSDLTAAGDSFLPWQVLMVLIRPRLFQNSIEL